ncbi:SAM-dependent DNA methyltransferase [Phocaeicola plebeius]|jgi:adenine-specific DNA-methyltransferase|uniref:site-specific DNA-methyltransferase (adenine-specific) n=1 Tax=Phocaeicola plebeius TaxID=310297 RepID=A0A3E4Z6A1_9BACT|nr:N-6 DNA methylase [Phocaeicola plebeius]RGM88942.1 SAM-dependent DNA methyltransferase [Phocaeicola plebeius]
MKQSIFIYLKRNGLSTIQIVNKLFVSAFLRHYGIVPRNNILLQEFYIKDNRQEEVILQDFIVQLNVNGCTYSLEELTQLFEFVISPSDRKVTGAIYTPYYIRKKIVDEVIEGLTIDVLRKKRFADISCGCGGFFLTIAQILHERCGKSYYDIFKDNIFGIDIQNYSIERTKLLLSLMALLDGEDCNFQFNLYVANTLSFDFSKIGLLDIIVGNPPYVCARNMTDESRELLDKWTVASAGNSDLYIPFFQIAIENIVDGGKIGLITMNSFLTSLNGRALRSYFKDTSYNIKIVDFRGYQVFHGKRTYTCLFFLIKEKSATVKYFSNPSGSVQDQDFNYEMFEYCNLDSNRGWKFNKFQVTRYIENVGIPLGEFCKTRHGIATLCNKVYVFQPIRTKNATFIFEKNGIEIEIEKDICRPIVNSNKFNSDVDLNDIIEYIIYPYFINSLGKAEIIDEEVLQTQFPLAYRYLKSRKDILEMRDKGNTNKYPAWYAFGRSQSLIMPKYKLFFPKIANRPLHCVICDDASLLLYNGISFVSEEKNRILLLKKVLESNYFWNYVVANSKPYSSNYYSLNGVNIMHFGIPCFTQEQIKILLSLKSIKEVNEWLRPFYG